MSGLLVVANESPWPVHNGGRARMAGMTQALIDRHDVLILAAQGGGAVEPGPVRVELLPPSSTSTLRILLGAAPRLGAGLLDRRGDAQVQKEVAKARPDAVLVTHSYLLPLLGPLDVPLVLDLPNLEVVRAESAKRTGPRLRRAVAAVDAVKARRWEPAAVRRAELCLVVSEQDAKQARRWGARSVVVVPNASDASPLPPSPPDGAVLAVADWRYEANAEALRSVLSEVWPAVRSRLPEARLLLVGRGAPATLPEGVSATGFVDDLTPCYAQAALALAPASSGGGTQVKVADAVARGRVVVATEYGAASLPTHAVGLCPATDDLTAAIVQLLTDVPERHRRERDLLSAASDWTAAVAPLREWLASRISRG